MLALTWRLGPRVMLLTPFVFLASVIGDTAPADPYSKIIDAILKGGPFAIILVLILLDKLDTTGERNLLRTQLAESQGRERALYEAIKTDLSPALIENSRLVGENTRAYNEVIKPLLERVARKLEE